MEDNISSDGYTQTCKMIKNPSSMQATETSSVLTGYKDTSKNGVTSFAWVHETTYSNGTEVDTLTPASSLEVDYYTLLLTSKSKMSTTAAVTEANEKLKSQEYAAISEAKKAMMNSLAEGTIYKSEQDSSSSQGSHSTGGRRTEVEDRMFDIKVSQLATTNLTDAKELRKEIGVDNEFNYNAFYMAIVEDTNDPLKLGRVRIRIPALHGGTKDNSFYIENEALPWAKPAILNGAGNDVGQFIIPTKGTRVFVTFEYNNRTHPIYFGGVITNVKKSTKQYNDNEEIFEGQEFTISTDDRIKDIDGEAYQVIYKSFKGATILVNDKDGEETLKIIDAAGQQITMKNSSEYALPRRENSTNPPTSASIEVTTNGELALNCDNLNLQANDTNLSDYVTTTRNWR